jgi:nucleotide-binding universal stress UspA family protein
MIHFNCTKILIPVDFSDTSMLAIKHGRALAQKTKAGIYLLHVVNVQFVSQNMFLPSVSLDQSLIEKKANDRLTELANEISKEYDILVQTIIKTGSPSTEVSKVAKEIGASLIVMGTHGYSPLEELVIGSTALKVITKAHCPTMAMSADATHIGYKTVVLPIDNTVNSRQKVHFTLEFAKRFDATVYAVGLLSSDEADETPAMELILHQIKVLAKEKNVKIESEILSNVSNRANATVKFVEKVSGDVIVIMTDQDAELSGFFLGPYSQQVIHLSKVPVIAIKPLDLFVDEGGFPSTITSGF